MKTAKLRLESIKEPDVFDQLASDLELDDDTQRRFFEFGEYANLELVVNADMDIVGGRFIPRRQS